MGRTITNSAFRALARLLLVGVVLGQSATCRADILTGLEAYYQFNGNGLDSSGNAYNLTLVGNPGFAPGKFGQALDLPGNDAVYAVRSVSDSAFDFGSNNFTVQVWVNFTTYTREETLIEKFNGFSGPGWTLTTPADHVQFYTDATGPINTQNFITTGVWYDVVAERNGNGFDLFVNGILETGATSGAAITAVSDPLLIGRRDAADGRDFSVNGLIDDVAIWNRALTTDEISTLWSNGAGTPVIGEVPEPSTLVVWSMLIGMFGVVWSYKRLKQAAVAA